MVELLLAVTGCLLFFFVMMLDTTVSAFSISALQKTSASSSASLTLLSAVYKDKGEELVPSTSSSSSRRDFLQQTASSVAAAAATATVVSPTTALASQEEAAAASVADATISTTTPLQLPPIGLGAWAWGDSLFWGYDKKNDNDLKEVFDYAVETTTQRNTTLLLDTAEVYGFGRSEQLIGDFCKKYPSSSSDNIQIATKFAALPIRTKASDVVKACQDSLKRLGKSSMDLYQIHFPNAWSNSAYWDGLADCYDRGLVKAVGTSNYGVDAVRACDDALAKRGIPLATNQIQYSLLYRYPEQNGLLQACEDLGVKVLSYSPLALGMLTGKYTFANPPQGPRKALYEKLMTTPDYERLLNVMKDVAAAHPVPGATSSLSQVALNWARAKHTVPIPGARTLKQIQSNYDSLNWDMSDAEVRALDVAASKVTTFNTPDMLPFPKEDIQTHLKMFDS